MTRAIALGTMFLGLSACASTPPEQAKPTVDRDAIAASPGNGGNAVEVETDPSLAAGSTGATKGSAPGEGLHVVEVPTVAKTATAPARLDEDHPEKLICRREKTTGSHRVTRVCRTRTQVELERDAGQTMVRDAIRSPDGTKIR